MKKLDVRKIIEGMRDTVKSHELASPGEYCRYLWQDEEGTRKMGINEYGCADALNILYIIQFHQNITYESLILFCCRVHQLLTSKLNDSIYFIIKLKILISASKSISLSIRNFPNEIIF